MGDLSCHLHPCQIKRRKRKGKQGCNENIKSQSKKFSEERFKPKRHRACTKETMHKLRLKPRVLEEQRNRKRQREAQRYVKPFCLPCRSAFGGMGSPQM